MNYGSIKSYGDIEDYNSTLIFGTGAVPINIKIAQLSTFANPDTKQQGYQVTEVNKLISTMLTGWDANGNKPKSMSNNYIELTLSCDNGFVVKKRLQFPHIKVWQSDDTPYDIPPVYKQFSLDNWLKADDFENPDITLVIEPTDEILTTSTATPPQATTTRQSGLFLLYYRNLPVGVNRVHIEFHIKTKTEPIDFDLEILDGIPFVKGMDMKNKNISLNSVKDLFSLENEGDNFEDITMYRWNTIYGYISLLTRPNLITHDLFFYPYV